MPYFPFGVGNYGGVGPIVSGDEKGDSELEDVSFQRHPVAQCIVNMGGSCRKYALTGLRRGYRDMARPQTVAV